MDKRYGLGRELETVDPETGNTVTAYSIDAPAAQRLAAEEYVARMAAAGVKPSWWREFIQKIRMALARLPGFREIRMTDRQIEILLARSARVMRRNVRTAAGTGVRLMADGVDSKADKTLNNLRSSPAEYERFYRKYVPGFDTVELIATAALPGFREGRRILGDYMLSCRDFITRADFPDEIGRYNFPADIHPSCP